jgi:hypothetical protein
VAETNTDSLSSSKQEIQGQWLLVRSQKLS